ncbi:MAG: hypothetical protein SGILL_003181, partial [Bacillariaceae sp.]
MYALTFAVGTGGVAHDCINILGGLNTHQLRWIYSNLTRADLLEDGWDPSSLKYDDLNDQTHLWSELDARCAHEEILISGADFMSSDYQFVATELFGDNFHTNIQWESIPIANPRQTGSDTFLKYYAGALNSLEAAASGLGFGADKPGDLANHVSNNGAAITFMKYPFALDHSDKITMVPIRNKYGNFRAPSATDIQAGDYTPFARMMHVNMNNKNTILEAMRGFFEFAYSARGKELVHEAGYIPVSEWEEKIMLAVLDADKDSWGDFQCGLGLQYMEIAGSVSAFPVAQVWSDVYRAKCGADVKVRGGGSGRGARRVCGTSRDTDVEIGTMARHFEKTEAMTTNGYEYDCVGTGKNVIQVETAIEAMVMAYKAGGVAGACIEAMGGLSVPQLRWIYSSLAESQLRYEGWSYSTIPNSDGIPDTHLWSELMDHPDCPATEIKIAGLDDNSPFLDMFSEIVLPSYGDGEDFASNRPSAFYQNENEEDLVTYLNLNGDAISFLSYSYYSAHDESIWAAQILNDNDEFIEPLDVSIADGTYTPFSRRIYMNVLDDPEALSIARPFLELGFSNMGTELVRYTGYVPIPESERIVMRARIHTASGFQVNSLECGPAEEVITMAGSKTTYHIARLLGDIYEIGCDVQVQIEGGGSHIGADRVCGGSGGPVDIGLMSREWKTSEGLQDGRDVHCTTYDTSRSSIQIPVAYSAIVLATASGGAAKSCIDSLGGLTPDQLRWIFSSYNEKELEAAGWNPNSIANPDFDESTHLWSELSSSCEATEIVLGGANDLNDIFYDFRDAILTDSLNGESVAMDRLNGYTSGATDSSTVTFLLENGAALAFFGINYYEGSSDSLTVVPVQNSAGAFVTPSDSAIQSGAYDILAKTLYMNVNRDLETLPSTVPLVRFGMSVDGSDLVAAAGFVPIPEEQRQEILSMLCATEGAPPSFTCPDDGLSPGGIAGIVILVVAVVGVLAFVVVRKRKTRKEADTGDANPSPYAGS